MKIFKNNFYSITGGPGGGKTSLITALRKKGFECVDETAREIIQKRLKLNLSPRPDTETFGKLMLEADIENFKLQINKNKIVFFDRSIIDSTGFIKINFPSEIFKMSKIAQTYFYNIKVFITPPWSEIYCNDNERDQTFEHAVRVYNELIEWYEFCGYKLIKLPKESVDKRIKFIEEIIKSN